MRRFLFLAFLLFFLRVPEAKAGPAFVQQCNNYQTGFLSASCTMSSATTAGNSVVCSAQNLGNGTITGVSDGSNGAYMQDANVKDTTNGITLATFHFSGSAGATLTVSAAGSATKKAIICAEVTGSVTVDGTPSTNGPSNSGSVTSNSTTTTSNGDFIFGSVGKTGGTITAGTGFTLITATGSSAFAEYETQTSAGAVAATATSPSFTWDAQVVAYKTSAVPANAVPAVY